MADRKISDLTALTAPASGDYLPIVDISEAAAASKNKRITIEELFRGVPSGTAAAPSIAIEGDEDTGVYSPGANQLAISTAGSGRLFVDASGRVGINSAPSLWLLEVKQDSASPAGGAYPVIQVNNPNANGYAGVYLNDSTAQAGLETQRNTGHLGLQAGGAERLRITSAGLVGIGTTNPLNKLVVSHNNGAEGIEFLPGYTSNRNITFHYNRSTSVYAQNDQIASAHIFRIASDSTQAAIIDSSGRLGVGTSSPGVELDVNGTIRSRSTFRLYSSSNDIFYIAPGTVITGGTANDIALRSDATGSILFSTNGATERMRIDSSGRLGIGTNATSPNQQLHVRTDQAAYTWTRIDNQSSSASAYAGLQLGAFGNTWGLAIGSSAANSNSLTFVLDAGGTNSEKMRLDTSGRLLVGTTTAPTGSSSQYSKLVVRGNSLDNGGGYIAIGNGTAASSLTTGSDIANIYFIDGAGGQFGSIQCFADAAPGTGDNPGRLVFSTTADGASSPTERMRIGSNGSTNFLSTGDTIVSRTSVAAGTTNALYFGLNSSTAVGNGNICFVTWSNGNVQNTNNSYGAYSDIKLKENIVDANSQWDDIKALQVRNYNLKEGQTHRQIGLVAQEVEPISPGLIYESPDRDEDGNDLGTVTKSVNYSVLYMKAVKALQEAMERIEQLEAKVAALESA